MRGQHKKAEAFRVHFASGCYMDVACTDPNTARSRANRWVAKNGRITKVKALRLG